MDNDQAILHRDPRYQEALKHLQAGRWNDAISGFEALHKDYPDDAGLAQAIDDARLKASLDGTTRIRARRWHVSWRAVIFRVLAATTILAVIAAGVWVVSEAVLPMMAEARVQRHQAQLLTQARAYLAAEDLVRAEANYKAYLAEVPDSPEAIKGLADVQALKEFQTLYQQALDAQDKGDLTTALQVLSDLTIKSPGYRDISSRITVIKKQLEVESLFTAAETAFTSGQNQEALDMYLQVKTLNSTYQADTIIDRLFTIYMRLGRELVEKRPPVPDDIQRALGYFTEALVLRPRDPSAMQEQRLADLFTKGLSAYQDSRWHDATVKLKSVYDGKPDYLGTLVVEMLYDAYIRSGDLYQQEGDIYRAYDDYLNASRLPVADPTLAKGRVAQLAPNITPSPTPLPTSTPRPTSVPSTGGGGSGGQRSTPTPTPSATPSGLRALRNRIVFRSTNPSQPGLWVMDRDGTNRQYMGNSAELDQQYTDLEEEYQLSPDKRYQVYVVGPKDTAQVYLSTTSGGSAEALTASVGASYDPSWSPDGALIVYVSEEVGSDDIWIMGPDGNNQRNLTPNNFYDKHPSWSPDNRSIAFWSNRAGAQQIFVMDADGRNARNISNSPWDEYDPLWIR